MMKKQPYSPLATPECMVLSMESQAIVCQSVDGVTGNGLETFSEENYGMFR